ncbi:MAG TPA: polysaccharide deacetylase family protein [Actinomycetota bacterium]|nr:polysaccharide deacetylase family protein [Actinomycetota bacterium]
MHRGWRGTALAAVAVQTLSFAAVDLARPAPASATGHGVTIIAPAAGQAVSGTVPVEASTIGTVTSVEFDWAVSSSGPWIPIATDTVAEDGWTTSWNTAPYTGPAVVRATAVEAVTGDRREHAVDVTVDNTIATFDLDVSPTPFSPNGDGRKDKTHITISTSEPGEILVELLDDEAVIRTWERTAGPGETVEISWNGKVEAKTVANGGYDVRATLTEPSGLQQEASHGVIVDTKAPTTKWRSIKPEPISNQPMMRFKFTVADRANDLPVTLVVRDRVAKVDEKDKVVSPGARTIRWPPRYPNGKLLFPGQYEARLIAHDDAGNVRRTKWKPWRVIRSVKARVFTRLGGTGRKVALTFDDCHFGGAWGDILDTLAARGVDATFFCPGQMMAVHPGLVRRTDNGGHTIASHAWDHALLTGHSSSYTASRLRDDARVAWQIARQTTAPFFRPPYGAYDAAVRAAAGATGHPRVVLWDVDPRDWEAPGRAAIVSRVVSQARPGSIILLHTLPQTAAALPAIITGLRARNLNPVDLPNLFRAAGMR